MHILAAVLILFTGFGFAQEETVPVLVTTRPLERGTVLVPDLLYGENPAIEVQEWPAALAPTSAYETLTEIEGLVVKLDLTARMPLLKGNLTSDLPAAAAIGSDTGLLTPAEKVGVPLVVANLWEAPYDMTPLDCLQVAAVFDFGIERVRYSLTDTAVLVENAADIQATVVTVAMDTEPALIAIWAQDATIPIAITYSDAC